MKAFRHIRCIQRLRAFSLIEVVVALVVASFGILGIAGFQLQLLRMQQSGQGGAVALVADIVERMRANDVGLLNGYYHISSTEESSDFVGSCYVSGGCSYLDRAQGDLSEWRSQIAKNLLSGQGIVCRLPTGTRCQDGLSLDNFGDLCASGDAGTVAALRQPYSVCIRWVDRSGSEAAGSDLDGWGLVEFSYAVPCLSSTATGCVRRGSIP